MTSFKKVSLVGFVAFLLALSLVPQQNTTIFDLSHAPVAALAQAKTCPDIVKTALSVTSRRCAGTGRNKVCYGNAQLTAEFQPDAKTPKFQKPGDTVNVGLLKSVHLGSLATDASTWGIALMRIQANLPDTAPGQNVTMLLFGDVQITDASKTSATQATQAAATAAATSQATPAPAKPYKPMQAFYFRTGVGEAACAEVPADGILIQSPEGKQKVELSVNEVRIVLGSSVFLTAQPSNELIVNTLEGSADVTAAGQTQTAPAGTRVRVPVDVNLRASGPPSQPEPYDYRIMRILPVNNLPKRIAVAAPLPPSNGIVTRWTFTNGPETVSGVSSCRSRPPGPPNGVDITMNQSGDTFWLEGEAFYSSGGGLFVSNYASGETVWHTEIRFTSATHADGHLTATIPGCTLNKAFTLDQTAAPTGVPTAAPTAAPTAS